LATIAGVSDIETDIDSRTCSFKLSDPNVDIAAELARLAASNEHLAEFTIQ